MSMGIILRYILKETIKAQIVIFLILITIFITLKFVRTIASASEGDIPAELIFNLMLLHIPGLATMLLPISFFIGIIIAQGRLYVDSEMTVLKACGVSEWYVTRVTLISALLFTLASGYLNLYIAPYTASLETAMKAEAAASSGVSNILPGRFQQTQNENRVIFVHDIDDNDQLQKVFLSEYRAEAPNDVRLVMAATGEVETLANGAQVMHLFAGEQYEGKLSSKAYQQVTFDQYSIEIAPPSATRNKEKIALVSSADLLVRDDLAAQAEWQWRIAVPLSFPLLVLIAVPLARVNPRSGRFGKLGHGIILYLVYFLLIIASKKAIEDGKLPAEIGIWWVHILMAIVGMYLLNQERSQGLRLGKLHTRRGNS